MVEYSVTTTDEDGQGNLRAVRPWPPPCWTDPAYPAMDLAELYHGRWQAETGIGDLKTAHRGGPELVLRSKTPAMVEQEF